jgi:hypothetical protein
MGEKIISGVFFVRMSALELFFAVMAAQISVLHRDVTTS